MNEPASKFALDQITKTFNIGGGRTRPVVGDVSFEAKAGEFVSIIGPSGCGKSTLFNIMAGLETPSSGTVSVNGAEVTGEREHFAYMPQKDLLFPWRTIESNAALGLQVQGMNKLEAKRRARDLMPKFGLQGFEKAHPFELSGGMRQRVALLRTVIQDREILLLDEPFGALDSLTRTEMQAWLQSVWVKNSWTAVLITHDVREAIYLSDRVIVLSARPTSVRLDLAIELERPRELTVATSKQFVDYEEQLLEHLHEEARKSLSIA